MDAFQEVNFLSISIRLALSLLFGGVIGMERGAKGRPAGIRTYMLVCAGSTLIMITNQYMVDLYKYGDPARLGAQVVNGIGFLGAGTIMVTGKNRVEGLTTAAGLWASASVGLALGIGFYLGATLGSIAIYTATSVMHDFSRKVQHSMQEVRTYTEFLNAKDLGLFLEYLAYHNIKVLNLELPHTTDDSHAIVGVFTLAIDATMNPAMVTQILKNAKAVQELRIY
jgi:putative Mg2+ transporter-C (MgtC) family protein